ncbi:MAG: hypothetical protein M3R13_11905 [Armatimonadota bacterium]|nr:hypothetical protein [Armatimonadota bacterium]
MINNYEANVLVTGTAATDLGSYFEELFEGAYAHNVTRRWLETYRKIWNERRENVESAELLRAKVLRSTPDPRPRPVPKGIKGHKFVFTGRIVGWPRDHKLYPYVRRLGGEVGPKSSAIPGAAALVQGETMGGRETEKLKVARKCGSLILTEQEFFEIARRQARRNR